MNKDSNTKRKIVVKPGTTESTLKQLAELFGIQTSYRDMRGEECHADPDSVKAILHNFIPAARTEKQLREALRNELRQRSERALPPVIVAWQGRANKVRIRATQNGRGSKAWVLLECGEKLDVSLPSNASTTPGDSNRRGRELCLPELPMGYHELQVETGGRIWRALIISSPRKSYSPANTRRDLGLFLPIYAVHSQSSWGAGNFGDWRALTDWAADGGVRVLGTLPLCPTFLGRNKCEPSPYSPISRYFWNELYIDIERLPEINRSSRTRSLIKSAVVQKILGRLRSSALIDYESQAGLQRKILAELAGVFFAQAGARRSTFETFCAENPKLETYARFRATMDYRKTSWTQWPERLAGGSLQDGDYLPGDRNFHLYSQWAAMEQMEELLAHGRRRKVDYYLDLPVGVHPDGFDVWRENSTFALEANVGAPPDICFPNGQDWGFPPMHSQRIRHEYYRYMREFLRFQMKHTGMLRIDHVMGLHRLYWIPRGFPASKGAYVRYQAEEMHAIVNLESHVNKTVVVGEDLGTVPPEVNEAMEEHRLRRMYVVQYAQTPNPEAALPPVPSRSVASMNTHDMPPFAAHWKGLDITERRKLKILTQSQARKECAERRMARKALLTFLRKEKLLSKAKDPRKIWEACAKWLAASESELVLLNLEDFWGETRSQNVPGTFRERPNWRRKALLSLEKIIRSKRFETLIAAFAALRVRRPTVFMKLGKN